MIRDRYVHVRKARSGTDLVQRILQVSVDAIQGLRLRNNGMRLQEGDVGQRLIAEECQNRILIDGCDHGD